jgi:hypothetical protein
MWVSERVWSDETSVVLYCCAYPGPPSKVEMSQIFHASLCGVHAAIDVNDAVDAICSEKCTAGWTGADIKACGMYC